MDLGSMVSNAVQTENKELAPASDNVQSKYKVRQRMGTRRQYGQQDR